MKVKVVNRIMELWGMHEHWMNADDESLYMAWIEEGVPDGTESMFDPFLRDIAEDETLYNGVVDFHKRLLYIEENELNIEDVDIWELEV